MINCDAHSAYEKKRSSKCVASGRMKGVLRDSSPLTSDLGSQRNFVFSPSSLQMSHSLKEAWTNMRVPSLLFMRKGARSSARCWKSSQCSAAPRTTPAFTAPNACSSVSGCRDATATLSSGSTRSNDDCVGKRMFSSSRYTSARLTGTTWKNKQTNNLRDMLSFANILTLHH